MPDEIGIGKDVFSFGDPVKRHDEDMLETNQKIHVGPLVLMTFPVNLRDLWQAVKGGSSNKERVERAFQHGVPSKFRSAYLYVDSIPVARHPSSGTQSNSPLQASLFIAGFDRVIKSGCKVIVVRHPANRCWLLLALLQYASTQQSIFDMSRWYGSKYGQPTSGIFVRNFAGIVGDHREFLFTTHPCTIGLPRTAREQWELYADTFQLVNSIVCEAYGYPYDTDRVQTALGIYLDSRRSVDMRLAVAKLHGLMAWRAIEKSNERHFRLDELPVVFQEEIRVRLGCSTSDATKESLLHLTLSAIATSTAGMIGLAAIESIHEQERSLEQQIALSDAYAKTKWQQQMAQYNVTTFAGLRSAKLREGKNCECDAKAKHSVAAMKKNSQRKWCGACRDPWGFANSKGPHHKCPENSFSDTVYLQDALKQGITTEEHVEALEIAHLTRGWQLIK